MFRRVLFFFLYIHTHISTEPIYNHTTKRPSQPHRTEQDGLAPLPPLEKLFLRRSRPKAEWNRAKIDNSGGCQTPLPNKTIFQRLSNRFAMTSIPHTKLFPTTFWQRLPNHFAVIFLPYKR
ncbi:hypothetical protein EDC01DRAFT_645260 [Geopyxis carbonaria]|nr:hypothetical protein EDC01DRAFT_645260 [Geopyxis carbonaria]